MAMKSIGLDLGTSAIKGVLYDGKQVLAEGHRDVPLLREGEKVEIDALGHWEDAWSLICELGRQSDEAIVGIAMAAASGNTLLTELDGTPRTRIVSWLDKRESPLEPVDLHELVGWPWNGGFPLVHLAWWRQHKPELMADNPNVFMNNDWLAFKLTGKRGLDHSSATPFFLQDQARGVYSEELLALVGLLPSQLSPLCPSGTEIGRLRPELANGNLTCDTKVYSGSFDHPSAARAVGMTTPGDILLSCGTSWVGFSPIDTRRVRKGFLCDPFESYRGGPWGEIFSIARIGLELESFIVSRYGDGADRYDLFNSEALATEGAARDLVLSTIDRFKSRLEFTPRRLVMVGGPSEGKAWRHFIGERLGLTVEISPFAKQAGAVGAAMLAQQ
jgi:xylulokinase